MDKKKLLSLNLAIIMESLASQILDLVKKHANSPSRAKSDGSPVTALDLALSELIEKATYEHFPGTTVYSEEKYSSWSFPLMAIDPLDGTKEFIKGRPEWVVSVAHLLSERFEGEGWIFNPLTGEKFYEVKEGYSDKPQYCGEVSHSEWDKGLYTNFKSNKFSITPMGSIAYKLGRLSAGKIDFVVSLAPKNIWDVAAGSVLCKNAGIKFWSQGQEVIEVNKLYQPPLIWCREEIFSELSELFPSKGKYP